MQIYFLVSSTSDICNTMKGARSAEFCSIEFKAFETLRDKMVTPATDYCTLEM